MHSMMGESHNAEHNGECRNIFSIYAHYDKMTFTYMGLYSSVQGFQ